jgi:CHAT domain-containing protein
LKQYRPLLAFAILSGMLILCFSQDHLFTRDEALKEYKNADRVYAKAFAETLVSEEAEENLNHEALGKFRMLSQNIEKTRLKYDSLEFFIEYKTGDLYQFFDDKTAALLHFKKAIALKKNVSVLEDSLLFKPLIYSGLITISEDALDTAMIYLQQAEAIQLKYAIKLSESERLYNILGSIFYKTGDFRKAKNYFQKAVDVLPKNIAYYKDFYVKYNINLAQVLTKLEQYDEANSIYKKLLSFNSNTNEINHNIGVINLLLGAGNNAIAYFKKVHYDNEKIIQLYSNTAYAYFNLKEYDSAKYFLDKAANENQRIFGKKPNIANGQTLKFYGDLYFQLDSPLKALHFYQQAIHQFYPSYSDTSIKASPEKFTGVFSYINLFNTLVGKAEAFHFLYVKTGEIANAIEELKAYQSAFKLIDYVERTYNSDEARLFLERTKYVAHTKPIDIAYELYTKTKEKNFIESLYVFDQQNKASVLSLNAQLKEQASSKDASVLTKERLIRTDITRLSLKAAEIKNDSELIAINKQIRDREIELGKLQEQISASTTGFTLPSIAFLEKKFLDNQTALISYHLSEDKLTTLLITKENFECYQQPLPSNFHELVTGYIQQLKQPDLNGASGDDSRTLFNFLFGNISLQGMKRLIIIPDDELNYLSFESLRDSNGKYLIQNYSVQYQYSTSLLKKETADFSGHQTLAFAPFASKGFSDTSIQLEALPNSLSEIATINGAKFTDSAATKINFLDNLARYKVLHLATHAVVNTKEDNLSFVSFYPSLMKNNSKFLLYTEEIYNLPLNKTDLVILSACETASGNLIRGEGVMSLSRAFAYAGCSDVITSLWNANDFSTAYLTNRVHLYLDKEYSIDAALQQAKLDYLNDRSINPRLKDPFYWSHLIFIGNYSPVRSSDHWWPYAAAGAFLLILLALFFKTRKPRISKA